MDETLADNKDQINEKIWNDGYQILKDDFDNFQSLHVDMVCPNLTSPDSEIESPSAEGSSSEEERAPTENRPNLSKIVKLELHSEGSEDNMTDEINIFYNESSKVQVETTSDIKSVKHLKKEGETDRTVAEAVTEVADDFANLNLDPGLHLMSFDVLELDMFMDVYGVTSEDTFD